MNSIEGRQDKDVSCVKARTTCGHKRLTSLFDGRWRTLCWTGEGAATEVCRARAPESIALRCIVKAKAKNVPGRRHVRAQEPYAVPARAADAARRGCCCDTADSRRQRGVRCDQGRPCRGDGDGAARHARRAGQFRRLPHCVDHHQRPQAAQSGRSSRDRRHHRQALAAVPRRRRRSRSPEVQSVDRRRDGAQALSGQTRNRHHRALRVRAVAGREARLGDRRERRSARALCGAPLRVVATRGRQGRGDPRQGLPQCRRPPIPGFARR